MKNFNPRLIFSQIVAMQCFHYLFLGLFFQINHVLYGESITIDRMFTDRYLRVFHTSGWPDALAVFLSYSVVGYVSVWKTASLFYCVSCALVGPAKKAPFGGQMPHSQSHLHIVVGSSPPSSLSRVAPPGPVPRRNNGRSFLMAIIVEKSKKCLDFSFTLLVVHFVIVCLYDGFPATWDWWIAHVVSMVSMVLLGEYLCARREMEDIPLLTL